MSKKNRKPHHQYVNKYAAESKAAKVLDEMNSQSYQDRMARERAAAEEKKRQTEWSRTYGRGFWPSLRMISPLELADNYSLDTILYS
jgi:hypothetical protein